MASDMETMPALPPGWRKGMPVATDVVMDTNTGHVQFTGRNRLDIAPTSVHVPMPVILALVGQFLTLVYGGGVNVSHHTPMKVQQGAPD